MLINFKIKTIQKSFLFVLLIMLCSYFTLASNYYADSTLYVSENGDVTIKGSSNHPDLQQQISQTLITKQKGYWLLNFSVPEKFTTYVFEIHFPKNTEINYIKSSGNVRIAHEEDHIAIIEAAENNTIQLLVQYKINPQLSHSFSSIYYQTSIALFIIIIIFIIYKISSRKTKKINTEALTKRQLDILKLIIKNKGSILQSTLEKQLDMPKSSLSRNLDALLRKGIIEKQEKGVAKLIVLKK